MPVGKIAEGNLPSQRMLKTMDKFIASKGLDASMGSRPGEVVGEAGGSGIEEVNFKEQLQRRHEWTGQRVRAGQRGGWMDPDSKLVRTLEHKEPVLDGIAEMAVKDWGVLESDVLSEAKQQGMDMLWYAAWGRKK